MSINKVPPCDSSTSESVNKTDTRTSLNNSASHEPNRVRRLIPFLVSHFTGKRSRTSINHNINAAEATSSKDDVVPDVNDRCEGGDPVALSNLIRQDQTFMRDAIRKFEMYLDDIKLRTDGVSDEFARIEAIGGRNEEVDHQIPSDLEIHHADGTATSTTTTTTTINNHNNNKKFDETKGCDELELRELKRRVSKLKSEITSNLKTRSVHSKKPHWIALGDLVNKIPQRSIPNLYDNPKVEHPTAFDNVKASFFGLPFNLKHCLLCFLRFPENATIKKQLMIYWWIGEGILPPIQMETNTALHENGKTAEDSGHKFLDELISKGFIEPVYSKRSFAPDSCIMRPLVRSVLNFVAQRIGFNPIYTLGPDSQTLGPGESRCLLNTGESIIVGWPELFSKMKQLEILYLGRWQSLASHHIELYDTKILDELKYMNQLRFLSLRGMSMITRLPWFISKLTSMNILDLKACHNLEVIPDEIGMLRNLTHLDMSECYFLEHMPKGLGLLRKLQVFKGFFVGDFRYEERKRSCTLHDLADIPKLRKLNIYTNMRNFPTEDHLGALEKFRALEKLTISWGGCSVQGETSTSKEANDAVDLLEKEMKISRIKGHCNDDEAEPTAEVTPPLRRLLTRSVTLQKKGSPTLPCTLRKLDLQCFRGAVTPTWLRPAHLMSLKKLYIRGGKFRDLGQFQEEYQWNVEILRLKHLSELDMDWIELKRLFPNLLYLENVQCPKLSFFLGDKYGVWMKGTRKSNQL